MTHETRQSDEPVVETQPASRKEGRDYREIAENRKNQIQSKATSTGHSVKKTFSKFFARIQKVGSGIGNKIGEAATLTLATPEMISDASTALGNALSNTAESVDATIVKAGDAAKQYVGREYHSLIENIRDDIAENAQKIEQARMRFEQQADRIKESVRTSIEQYKHQQGEKRLRRTLEIINNYNKFAEKLGKLPVIFHSVE